MKRLLGVEASDLDFYLFDREARMDQVWASEPAGVVGEMGSDRIHSATAPGLRISDGSIMPRITVGNTMAPCVVIGERAAEILRQRHNLGVHEMHEKEELV